MTSPSPSAAIPSASDTLLEVKDLRVYFDTAVRDLPWSFEPVQRTQTVKIGATNIAFFKVENRSDHLFGSITIGVSRGS